MKSRIASFFEDVFPCKSKEEPSSLKQVIETINGNSHNQDKDGEVEPRRTKRVRTEKYFGLDFMTYVLEGGTSNFQRGIELYRESHMEKGHYE